MSRTVLSSGAAELRLSALSPYREAVFSLDRVHRYRLYRWWAPGPSILFVMLNPSTADDRVEDPTIRRCMGFSRRWGYGSLEIGNLFALRSTDPNALRVASDPVGPENDEWLARMAGRADQVVAAWRAWGGAAVAARATAVLPLLGRTVLCLGLTLGGRPRHPLYVAGDTSLICYARRRKPYSRDCRVQQSNCMLMSDADLP